jgi:Na+/proline symporter
MTKKNAFYVFVAGFLLLASHNIDNLILYGFDPFPLLEMVPYVLITAFWFRMKDWLTAILVLVFSLLELNHTRVDHIPTLLEIGLGRKTFSGILFNIGATVWFFLALFQLYWIVSRRKKTELTDYRNP